MKISTKGRYGLRAMYDLALHYNEQPISLKDISERQDISHYYLEQLMTNLRKKGLVKSVRGAQGGYILNGTPEDITVGSIFRALEGDLSLVVCGEDNESPDCTKQNDCATKTILVKITNSINNVINTTTLQDMLDEHN